MALFTSHNQEAHRQWFDNAVMVCDLKKKTRLTLRAFLYEYENRVRIMGDGRGWWFSSINEIAESIGAEYRSVRCLLTALKTASLVSIKTSSVGSRIKINNYEKLYGIQKPQTSNETASPTSSETAIKRQLNRIEEGIIEEEPIQTNPVVVPASEALQAGGNEVSVIEQAQKERLRRQYGIPDPSSEPEVTPEPPSPFDTPSDPPPPEVYAIIKRFAATLSIPLTPRPYEVQQLQAERRKGRLSDEQMTTAIIEGAKWILDNTRNRPMKGIMGILRQFDPYKKPGAKRFEKPEEVRNPIKHCPVCKQQEWKCKLNACPSHRANRKDATVEKLTP